MRQLAKKKTMAQEKEQVPLAVFTQESYDTRCSGQKKAELNFWTHMPITICSRKTRLHFTPSTQLPQLQTTGKRNAVDSSWKTPVEIEVDNDEPGTSASSCLSTARDVLLGLVFNKRCETMSECGSNDPKLGFSCCGMEEEPTPQYVVTSFGKYLTWKRSMLECAQMVPGQ